MPHVNAPRFVTNSTCMVQQGLCMCAGTKEFMLMCTGRLRNSHQVCCGVVELAYLHEAVVSKQQGVVVDAEVEDAVVAPCNADALASSNDAHTFTLLHTEQAAHCPHHNGAIAAAGYGCVLQRGQHVDGCVMAVGYPHDAHRELIFTTRDCGLDNALNFCHLPCIQMGTSILTLMAA